MQAYIPTKDELEEIISQVTKRTVLEVLPKVIREATRKEWLTTDDVMEILQCSRRHVQHLRDSEQLAYSQNARTIRYHKDDVDAFLRTPRIESREK